jgi:serine/threonine protein kinase
VGSGGKNGCAKHTNFCKVFYIFVTNTKVCIFVNEYQSLSIETRLKSGDTISEYEAKRWVRQVAEAMSYLHSFGVSHNNLRPENVIFDKENGIKIVGLDMTSIY